MAKDNNVALPRSCSGHNENCRHGRAEVAPRNFRKSSRGFILYEDISTLEQICQIFFSPIWFFTKIRRLLREIKSNILSSSLIYCSRTLPLCRFTLSAYSAKTPIDSGATTCKIVLGEE